MAVSYPAKRLVTSLPSFESNVIVYSMASYNASIVIFVVSTLVGMSALQTSNVYPSMVGGVG